MLKKTKITNDHQLIIDSHKLYENGEYLLCDISPSDEYQYWNKVFTDTRLNHVHSTFQCNINVISSYCSEFEYVIEISKEGRIHYHMNLKVNNITSLVGYIGHMRYKYGIQIKLDRIKDIEYRELYIRKDRSNMLRFYKKDHTMPQPSPKLEHLLIPQEQLKSVRLKDKLTDKRRKIKKIQTK